MPAILPAEFHDAWLDRRTNRIERLRMLKPFPSSEMKMHPVSNNVNSPDNDTANLLVPVDAEVGQTLSLF
jgi:putative SOS response-associated peptidase YedK